jgi:cysteinyl-tRNA synthetase
MDIAFFNTKNRIKEKFTPIDENNVRMYVCGPTVYDRAHIGNARPAVVFDLLFRLLKYAYGPNNVTYVRNFTDIDDKINQKAQDTGREIREITDETIGWYEDDMKDLNVQNPTFSPRATDYIEAMIKHILILIENGNAYVDGNGHVYFSVKSYPGYGYLSKRKLDELELGARIEINEDKKKSNGFCSLETI